jgi:hypothetical protein
MKIYISRNKEKFGPYTTEDVQALINQGVLAEMDYAWAEDASEWTPLAKVEGLDFSREKKQVNLDEALKLARQREGDSTAGIQPMANIGHDLKNLRRNVSATADELRDFLGQMKGKSPKEMLGLVAQSTLTKGFMQSIIIFSALILVFTVIPFTVGLFKPKEEKKVQTLESAPANVDNDKNNSEATTATDPEGNPSPTGETGNPVIDKLGIGEAKEAPKAVNPLDDTGDDLFDELK